MADCIITGSKNGIDDATPEGLVTRRDRLKAQRSGTTMSGTGRAIIPTNFGAFPSSPGSRGTGKPGKTPGEPMSCPPPRVHAPLTSPSRLVRGRGTPPKGAGDTARRLVQGSSATSANPGPFTNRAKDHGLRGCTAKTSPPLPDHTKRDSRKLLQTQPLQEIKEGNVQEFLVGGWGGGGGAHVLARPTARRWRGRGRRTEGVSNPRGRLPSPPLEPQNEPFLFPGEW